MAYDEDLAERVREQLAAQPGVSEKLMFGRLMFMLGGTLAVGVAGDELIVRVGPEAVPRALAHEHARAAQMRGRAMKGWVLVSGEADVGSWVADGVEFARSLARDRPDGAG